MKLEILPKVKLIKLLLEIDFEFEWIRMTNEIGHFTKSVTLSLWEVIINNRNRNESEWW